MNFQIEYPEIEDGAKPRHRFMSSYEQVLQNLCCLNRILAGFILLETTRNSSTNARLLVSDGRKRMPFRTSFSSIFRERRKVWSMSPKAWVERGEKLGSKLLLKRIYYFIASSIASFVKGLVNASWIAIVFSLRIFCISEGASLG